MLDLIIQCRKVHSQSSYTTEYPFIPVHMSVDFLQGNLKYLRSLSLDLKGLQVLDDYA